ncbi:unnamed protein product, partial [marine sediment metagenome]
GTRMQIRCNKYLPPLVILTRRPGPAPVRENADQSVVDGKESAPAG